MNEKIKDVGKKCKILYFLIVCVCLLTGCRNSEVKSRDAFISCDYNLGKEEYMDDLMKIKTDDQTLVIYTPLFYSNDGVMELNRLLKEAGYTFQIQIRQVPDEYAYSMGELADDLKEKGIQADIFGDYISNLRDVAKKGIFLNLEKCLSTESGKKLREQLPERYWNLSAIKGQQYFIGFSDAPNIKGWSVNQELMDKYGFSEADLSKPLEELEDIFQKVWEGEKDDPRYQTKMNDQVIVDFSVFTMVSYNLVYSLPFSFVDEMLPVGFWNDNAFSDEKEPKLVNLFDTERMRDLTETLNRYYQKGYIRECEEGIPESHNFFMQPDYNGSPICRRDSLDTWTNRKGIILKRIPYYTPSTTDLTVMGNAILNDSVHQEEAFDFLSFVMTSQAASDFLFYGKEGIDYERTEDGMVETGENLDQSYRDKSLGNLEISSPVSPYEDRDKAELMKQDFNALMNNPLYGFEFDETPVQKQVNEVSDIYNCVDFLKIMFMFEKHTEVEENTWEEYYDNYCERLKKAGIDDVVKEMNRQLKVYLNENGN